MSVATGKRSEEARLLGLRHWRRAAGRLLSISEGWTSLFQIFFALGKGFLELHIPVLRNDRLRSFEIGDSSNRRRIFVRRNGIDTFTFYEVFVKRAYDCLFPLRSSDVVLDLGANIGMASAYFDFRCPGIRILAVEPEGSNCELWRLNVVSTSAELVEAAVAATVGEVLLAVTDPTSHHLVDSIEDGGRPVAGVTLDSLVEGEKDGTYVIKCDIEGAEREVFSRRWDVLGRTRVIAMEVHGEETLPPIERTLSEAGLQRLPRGDPELPEVFSRR